MGRKRRRNGHTLFELLVVVAIFAVLTGLILPAVQGARNAALRLSCKSRLRNIGLALHQFHDEFQTLPAGVQESPFSSLGPSYAMTIPWHVQILPQLDQGPLYQEAMSAYRADPFVGNNPPHNGADIVLKAYVCPADNERSLNGRPLTSYLGVAGTSHAKGNGVLFEYSQIHLLQVTDGLSNTLMVGERPTGIHGSWGGWYGGWGQTQDGFASVIMGVRERAVAEVNCSLRPMPFAPGNIRNPCDFFHFWSQHGGGSNFLFADGSVRFLSYSADATLPALATRSGGEVDMGYN